MAVPMLLVDAAAALVFTASATWCAYVLACRWFADAPWHVRVNAAAVTLIWLLNVLFLLLSVPRLFTRPVALALWGVLAALAHRSSGTLARRLGRADLAAIGAWWRGFNSPTRILAGVSIAIVGARLGHGLLAPPLTWDSLTYHLYKPAAWIRAGGLVSTAGPDAAAYYQWFPPYGDVIWAWWLLAARGDTLIAAVAAGTWLMVLTGAYGAARALGATVTRATLAALAVALTPAVVTFMAAPYVDNLVVALFCVGALFLDRALERQDSRDALVAAATFGILAGVKSSTLPLCAIGVLGSLAAVRWRLGAALGVLAAAAPAAVPALLAWHATGSPVYPMTLRIGSRVVFGGNAELDWLLRGEWIGPVADSGRAVFLERLFLPWVLLEGDFMNLGLGVVVLAAASLGGLWVVCSVKDKRLIVAFHLLAALVTIASVAGHDTAALRVWWWPLFGRLVTIPVAVAAILAAAWPSRLASALLYASAAVSVASTWPHGLTLIDVHAGSWAVGSWVAAGIVCWLVCRVVDRKRTIAALGAMVMIAVLIVVRDRYRGDYYAAAATLRGHDVQRLNQRLMSSWPLWLRFEGPAPATLAVSAGWGSLGHNWWLYPLTGRHQQNRLLYVPITTSGANVDHGVAAAKMPPTSCDLWVARLLASEADFLVLLPPMPPEARWAEALPQILESDVNLGRSRARAYRVRREAPVTAHLCSDNGVE